MREWWNRGWPMLLWLFMVIVLVDFMYLAEERHPQYVGWCEKSHPFDDEWYWRQKKGSQFFCAEMHRVPSINQDKPQLGGDGWWYVYIIGTKQEGVFATQADAEKWADEQKLVVDPKQVR